MQKPLPTKVGTNFSGHGGSSVGKDRLRANSHGCFVCGNECFADQLTIFRTSPTQSTGVMSYIALNIKHVW
jgi:hypothetical protein